MFDVKATEAGLPLHFSNSRPAPTLRGQRARSRAAEAGSRVQEGLMPVAVPDLPPFHIRVRDLRERRPPAHPSGRLELGENRHERQLDQLWAYLPVVQPFPVSIASVARRRPASSSAGLESQLRSAASSLRECLRPGFDGRGPSHIRGWSTGNGADRSQRFCGLLPGSPACRMRTLRRADCSGGGIQARGRPRRDTSFDRHR